MCLAIPGQILEFVDESNRLAKVDVAGVRRTVNVGLLDEDGGGGGPVTGSSSTSDSPSPRWTRKRRWRPARMLESMGADYEQELEELKASVIE